MNKRRVFRDYVVLLAADQTNLSRYKEMLDPMGFGGIETIDDGKQILALLKKVKPKLVVVASNLYAGSEPELLNSIRKEEAAKDVPFLIIGDHEDPETFDPGKNGDKTGLIKAVGEPQSRTELARAVVELLDPLIDPKQEEAYGLIDEALEKAESGDLNGAVEKYYKALGFYDRHLGAWLKLAGILAELDRRDEVELAYMAALETDSNSLQAYFGLAEYYEVSQQYEQTVGVLRHSLSIAKKIKASGKSLARINFFIGEFELRLKRLTDAKNSFDKAIENNPDDAQLRADIGDAYADKGHYEKSEEHYQAALEFDPNLAHVFNKLGIAYRRQKKHDKAFEVYNNARRHHPRDENLMFNMARTQYETGQMTDAIALLEKALNISPDFKEARLLLAKLRSVGDEVELDKTVEKKVGEPATEKQA